jgi:hypothetical protein
LNISFHRQEENALEIGNNHWHFGCSMGLSMVSKMRRVTIVIVFKQFDEEQNSRSRVWFGFIQLRNPVDLIEMSKEVLNRPLIPIY